jgi:hypothetical protein
MDAQTEIHPNTRKSWFTKENAAEMAARALEARKQAEIMRLNGEPPKPLLPEEKYRILTLARTRKQIERLFEMMDECDDAQKLDRLASALARLNEQERQLAGRPLPGSLKPTQQIKPRRTEPIAPIESGETPQA